ncbi:MAG: S-ribosylhomocysteine lyase [Eubacteriales bacterium]|nr:S-ribosylhomocysteine lyase [Eubacteriales bacterium]
MKQNASFMVDHRRFSEGLYISRIDGDITTFDMRTRKPNSHEVMDNVTMHTFEHMFSTYIRNTDLDVLYFGPMGCQTGFYLLVRNADNDKVLSEIKSSLSKIISHEGEVFGASEIECGNYLSLSLPSAVKEAERYLEVLTTSPVDYKYY